MSGFLFLFYFLFFIIIYFNILNLDENFFFEFLIFAWTS